MTRYVELSHPIASGEGAYRGFPHPVIEPYRTREQTAPAYQNKASFEISGITMVGNTGTYIDSPYHRFDHEDDLAMMPLEILVNLPITIVDVDPPRAGSENRAINLSFDPNEIRGHAVLFRTGWDARWLTEPYWEPGPFLGPQTLDSLIGAATLCGVDFANVDDRGDPARPAHTRLLSAGMPIVEHMCNLAAVPKEGARLYCAPLAIRKCASFPVRAFAQLDPA
ncbi:MAG: cyclase family protein [Actinomycetota bacterium]